jgi:hypothetical protein
MCFKVANYTRIARGKYVAKSFEIKGVWALKPFLILDVGTVFSIGKKILPVDETTVKRCVVIPSNYSGTYRYVYIYWKDGGFSLVECTNTFIDAICRNFPLWEEYKNKK